MRTVVIIILKRFLGQLSQAYINSELNNRKAINV